MSSFTERNQADLSSKYANALKSFKTEGMHFGGISWHSFLRGYGKKTAPHVSN
jgi:hypothetical protein